MRFKSPTMRQQLLAQFSLTADQNPPGESDGGAAPADTADQPPAGGDATASSSDDDIAKLQNALERERQLKRQLERQLKEVSQTDPRLVEEARAKAEAAEQQRLMIEQQTTLRLQEQERKFQEQLQRLTGELQAKTTAAEREALRVKTEREFLAAKGATEASAIDGRTPFDYIWQVFGTSFAEDKQGLYIVDRDGDPVMDEETGKRLTPREYFGRLRKDPVHGMHFQPEYGSGSGARGGRDGRVSNATDLGKVPTSQLFRESFGAKRRTA
jgi:hypothetical protein